MSDKEVNELLKSKNCSTCKFSKELKPSDGFKISLHQCFRFDKSVRKLVHDIELCGLFEKAERPKQVEVFQQKELLF
jgi:hypothetical protein